MSDERALNILREAVKGYDLSLAVMNRKGLHLIDQGVPENSEAVSEIKQAMEELGAEREEILNSIDRLESAGETSCHE
jgi:hypothetical protein